MSDKELTTKEIEFLEKFQDGEYDKDQYEIFTNEDIYWLASKLQKITGYYYHLSVDGGWLIIEWTKPGDNTPVFGMFQLTDPPHYALGRSCQQMYNCWLGDKAELKETSDAK